MRSQPAASGKISCDTAGQQGETHGEGAGHPAHLDTTFCHEPIQKGQHNNEDRRLGKERGTPVRRDRDQLNQHGRRDLGLWNSTISR